jgi:hypothetical protein
MVARSPLKIKGTRNIFFWLLLCCKAASFSKAPAALRALSYAFAGFP